MQPADADAVQYARTMMTVERVEHTPANRSHLFKAWRCNASD